MSNIGYIRISTGCQNAKSQKLAILEHCNKNKIVIDEWIEVTISSRKSKRARRIDELLNRLKPKDTLIVSELSRLGRSVGEIAAIVDHMIKYNKYLVCLKENIVLTGKHTMQSKVMIHMFSLFAEIERDLISERTKEGLIAARAKGNFPGRPKGSIGKSKLDGKEEEIKGYMNKGVNITNIAKIYDCTWITMNNFIKSRKLKQ